MTTPINAWSFDCTTIQLPESPVAMRDGKRVDFSWDKALPNSKGKTSLDIEIRATHSGALINQKVYPGKDMKDSMHTWTKPYSKLITDGHPQSSFFASASQPEQLGRVLKAEYVRTENDDAKFKDDWKEPKEGEGSGYAKLVARISDPASIEKILDERFLTVSQGARLHRLVCSICGADWVRAGRPCEHVPGQVYEKEGKDSKGNDSTDYYRCFQIAGPMTYDHCAVVNRPADVYATILGHDSFDSSVFKQVSDGQVPIATVSAIALIDELGPTHLLIGDSGTTVPQETQEPLHATFVSLPTFGIHPVANIDTENPMGDLKKSKDKDVKPAESTPKEADNGPEKEDGTKTKATAEETKSSPEKDPKGPEKEVTEPEPKEAPSAPKEKEEEEGKDEELPEEKSYSDSQLIQFGSILTSESVEMNWTSAGLDEKDLEIIKKLDEEKTSELRNSYEDDQKCGPFVAATQEQIDAAKDLLIHMKVEDKAKLLISLENKAKAIKSSKRQEKNEKGDVQRLQSQCDNMKAALESRNDEQRKLFDQLVAVDTTLRTRTAESIVLLKQTLNKEDVDFSSEDTCREYIQELASREWAYLDGIFTDLRSEVGTGTGFMVLTHEPISDPTRPGSFDEKDKDENQDDSLPPKKLLKPGSRDWEEDQFENLIRNRDKN